MVQNQSSAASTAPQGPTPLSPAARKRLHQCYERGVDMAKKGEFDYAHSMFSECVLNDLANLEYVEAMLSNLQKKYRNNKKGARIKGFGGRGGLKKAIAAEDWDEVFRMGFDILKSNPWDVQALRAIADGCKANRFNEVELRYLKNALDANPKDLEVNRHCAESLTRMGQFDQAIACWHRIETLDKKNSDAKQRISELTVAKQTGVMPDGTAIPSAPPAVEPATEPAEVAPEPSAAQNVSAEVPEPSAESEIEQLEALVQQDAADVDDYETLTKAYWSVGRHRDALQMLKTALQTAGGSIQLRELYEDAHINMIKSQVQIAEQRAAREKTDEAISMVKRFRTELNRQEVQVYAARCDRYPNDDRLKYELAVRLKRDGNYREAAKYYELARGIPEYRNQATFDLGECCQQLRQYGNALKCYQASIDAYSEDQPERLLALYRGGVLAAALKKYENAEKYLAELVDMDSKYRDAAARLDKVRQISDSA